MELVLPPTIPLGAPPPARLVKRIPAAPSDSASPNPEKLKLRRATEEFEAILLSSWWEQMQKSFPAASESEQEPGFDTLRELSYRALAVALASRGGIGVASLMLRQLEPALPNSPPATPAVKTKTE